MKNRCFKVLCLVLAALMILALAGCGTQKPAEPGTDVELTGDASPAESQPESQPVSQTETPPVSQTENGTEPQTEKGGVIVVYFSRTGHTKPLAEYIKEELDADIYEIEAKVPYTDDDIKYYTDCRADREQADPSARPEIAGELPDLSGYDTVFLGYPIWHGQAPKIVYTFLESIDLGGKTVIPFCTSASSPVGSSAENLHALAPNANWRDGTRFAIGTSEAEIEEWLSFLSLPEITQKEASVLKLTVEGTELNVLWENNESVAALKVLAADGPLIIQMSPYGGFEQVGSIGQSLPRDDTQITTCDLNLNCFRAFFEGYLEAYDNGFRDYAAVFGVAYTWLEWLEYNLRRSLEPSFEEPERTMGRTQVKLTLDRIRYLHGMETEIKRNLAQIR